MAILVNPLPVPWLFEGWRVALSPVVEVSSPNVLTEGFSFNLWWMVMNTPRRDNRAAKSRERCSYKHMSSIVLRIDHPLATDPVSPCPSRLDNVRYCLICLVFPPKCRRWINTRLITRVVANKWLGIEMSWVIKLTKQLGIYFPWGWGWGVQESAMYGSYNFFNFRFGKVWPILALCAISDAFCSLSNLILGVQKSRRFLNRAYSENVVSVKVIVFISNREDNRKQLGPRIIIQGVVNLFL